MNKETIYSVDFMWCKSRGELKSLACRIRAKSSQTIAPNIQAKFDAVKQEINRLSTKRCPLFSFAVRFTRRRDKSEFQSNSIKRFRPTRRVYAAFSVASAVFFASWLRNGDDRYELQRGIGIRRFPLSEFPLFSAPRLPLNTLPR